jgi:hypothetical protein
MSEQLLLPTTRTKKDCAGCWWKEGYCYNDRLIEFEPYEKIIKVPIYDYDNNEDSNTYGEQIIVRWKEKTEYLEPQYTRYKQIRGPEITDEVLRRCTWIKDGGYTSKYKIYAGVRK